MGSVNDTAPLAQRLAQVFQQRKEQRAYKVGMETRTDLKEDDRIEKTVFVKAPRATEVWRRRKGDRCDQGRRRESGRIASGRSTSVNTRLARASKVRPRTCPTVADAGLLNWSHG